MGEVNGSSVPPPGDAGRWDLQREKFNSVPHLSLRHDGCNEGDVAYSTANRDPQLVAVDHAGEFPSGLLPAGCQNQKITILGEDHSPEFEGPLQEPTIIPVGSPVFGDGQHIDLELPQSIRDGRGHMMIQIEGEAHWGSPAFRSFSLTGDGSCRDAIKSTSLSCSWISESKCWR